MPSSPSKSKAIGPNDVVTVHGQHLYTSDGARFMMKGIAFPVSAKESYNATAWIGILEQLHSFGLAYNTVRVYEMDPKIDYSEFFAAAASYGVYVIVPLTARAGHGVLSRDASAPKCYKRGLYEYGVAALQNYLQYPNVLGGLLANEVMNTEASWSAAPCIKAYARDLKGVMRRRNMRPLPLIYAAQHSGIGQIGDVGTMWLTMNYLTCIGGNGDAPGSSSSIDVFGVNIESWCSSRQSFVRHEDGSAGSYYSLWLGLHQSTVPLVFTEMGCSHMLFDRDNGLHTPEGTRDWGQVGSVLHEMSDTWSGFCAYAYQGNPQFDMFAGGPWRSEVLEPTKDFFNFRDRLREESKAGHSNREPPLDFEKFYAPRCAQVEDELRHCCNIDLYPLSKIRSYEESVSQGRSLEVENAGFIVRHLEPLNCGVILAMAVGGILYARKRRRRADNSGYEPIEDSIVTRQST
ncbi:hypothetical protein ACHAXT_010949 [Thalassiosira profunda]